MGNDLIHAAQYADGMLADMGSSPLSRRGFAAAGLLAASAAVFGLPEGFGLTTREALADTTYGVDVGSALHNHIIRIRPEGFWNMANVHYDGSGVGDVCQLYGIGTSSKHQVLYDSSKGPITSTPSRTSRRTSGAATPSGTSTAEAPRKTRSSTCGTTTSTA